MEVERRRLKSEKDERSEAKVNCLKVYRPPVQTVPLRPTLGTMKLCRRWGTRIYGNGQSALATMIRVQDIVSLCATASVRMQRRSEARRVRPGDGYGTSRAPAPAEEKPISAPMGNMMMESQMERSAPAC